jgi:hypothetical protein
VFARRRHSPAPGLRRSSAFSRFQRLLVRHSLAPGVCPSSLFARTQRSQRSLAQRSLARGIRQSSACAPSRCSIVSSAWSSGIHSPPALTRPQCSLVLGAPSARSSSVRQSSACTRSRQLSVLGVRSFSALARSQRSLIRHLLVPGARQSSPLVLIRPNSCECLVPRAEHCYMLAG